MPALTLHVPLQNEITPLMVAARLGHTQVVETLLQVGRNQVLNGR